MECLIFSGWFDASTGVIFIVVCLLLLQNTTASFIRFTQLPTPFKKIGLLIMCNNVLLNLSMNSAFKSLYVEHNSVSNSLSKDLNLKKNSLNLSTHNFSGFLLSVPLHEPSDKIILKPLVIDVPALFFKVIAQAFLVKISITVNIRL